MFEHFVVIENVIFAHFKGGHIYVRDTFQECISKISQSEILPICCESQRNTQDIHHNL